jgi:hypothetical protein
MKTIVPLRCPCLGSLGCEITRFDGQNWETSVGTLK